MVRPVVSLAAASIGASRSWSQPSRARPPQRAIHPIALPATTLLCSPSHHQPLHGQALHGWYGSSVPVQDQRHMCSTGRSRAGVSPQINSSLVPRPPVSLETRSREARAEHSQRRRDEAYLKSGDGHEGTWAAGEASCYQNEGKSDLRPSNTLATHVLISIPAWPSKSMLLVVPLATMLVRLCRLIAFF